MGVGKRILGWSLAAALSCTALAQTPVEEHWSPYDYPREIPADVPFHIIQEGDTLWSLAGQYLGDPLLWPQLYQANAYIQDPDLIYPGDPILLNVGVIVDDQSISDSLADDESGDVTAPGQEGSFGEETELTEVDDAAAGDDAFAEEDDGQSGIEQVGDRTETTIFEDAGDSEFVIIPAGDRSDMDCSTYIYHAESRRDAPDFEIRVSGGENRTLRNFATGDIVYINQGLNQGIQGGDVYSIRRIVSNVTNPVKETEFIGFAIDQVARLRVIAVQDLNATAIITEACQEVQVDDFLVPYEQEPIPLITELPSAERYKAFNDSNHGHIIWSEDRVVAFGKGHLTNVTLGIENNIAPGDIFIIFRENPGNDEKRDINLPHLYLGHGVALRTGPQSSVMKVIEGYRELRIGDRVVPYNTFLE